MKENSQSLSCVMIPVSDRQLLLPNVSIAEVVDFYSTDAGASTPEWLVGFLDWRGLTLPVISYDAANGGILTVPGDNRGRIIVLNTIGDGHQQAPFMALVTGAFPARPDWWKSKSGNWTAKPDRPTSCRWKSTAKPPGFPTSSTWSHWR